MKKMLQIRNKIVFAVGTGETPLFPCLEIQRSLVPQSVSSVPPFSVFFDCSLNMATKRPLCSTPHAEPSTALQALSHVWPVPLSARSTVRRQGCSHPRFTTGETEALKESTSLPKVT